MARYPTKVDFAIKPSTEQQTLSPKEKYYQTLVENGLKTLQKFLAVKSAVVMVMASGNYVRIFLRSGCKKYIYASFSDACELLPGKLFYHPIRGTVVNLAHWADFKGEGRCVRLLLLHDWEAKMNRDEIKKLEKLKLYLSSNEFIAARKRQLE